LDSTSLKGKLNDALQHAIIRNDKQLIAEIRAKILKRDENSNQ
jgi:hypothetical protein